MQDFHKLKVWEKAHALAIDVHRVVGAFPRIEGVALIGQLRRAALSIPANIAEGAGKQGNAEFRRFLHMALGSAVETDYHLLAGTLGCWRRSPMTTCRLEPSRFAGCS